MHMLQHVIPEDQQVIDDWYLTQNLTSLKLSLSLQRLSFLLPPVTMLSISTCFSIVQK